jgi:hypothetical protein
MDTSQNSAMSNVMCLRQNHLELICIFLLNHSALSSTPRPCTLFKFQYQYFAIKLNEICHVFNIYRH